MKTSFNRSSTVRRRTFSRRTADVLAGLLLAITGATAATVSETATELLASGDCNGDGRLDAIVLDKATGNVRVGYQAANGTLAWAAPVPTRVPHASSMAVGGFLQASRDAIAVTSPNFNRVHLIDLSTPGVVTTPIVIHPPHADLSMMVALENPYGTAIPGQNTDWLATGTHDPGLTLLDLLTYSILDGQAFFQDQIASEGTLESATQFQRSNNDVTLLAAMRRGSNDTFLAYAYTNTSTPMLTRTLLPAGTEFVAGRFYNQTYAQVLFYVPGESNVTVQALMNSGSGIGFGAPMVTSFPSAVEKIYYFDEGTNGVAIIRFGDGVVSGLRPPSTGGTLQVAYGLGLGASGNVVNGAVPLGIGRFALLTGVSNTFSSAQAQIFTKNNTGYVQSSTSTLSAPSTAATRANVWLFTTEPFVNARAGFIASLNGGEWTTALSGLPGTVRVRAEVDQGTTTGLGGAITNTLGAPPSGTVFGLANQYHPAISLFSYSAPRAADPSRINISPAPGAYSAAIDVSLSKVNPLDTAYYRVNGSAWTEYVSPLRISNNVTIAYYGQTQSGERGSVLQAAYTISGGTLPPLLDTNNISGGATNSNGGTNGGGFQISTTGTIFYGRQSGSTGSVWAIHLDGTRDTFIAEGTRPRVSPDGRWLAFTREGAPFLSLGNLWLRDLTTGEERRLFTNPNFVVHYDWLNDSSGLVFDYECMILKIGLDGMVTDLPMGNDCFDDAPVVNPFDGRLAFHNLNAAPNRGLYQTDPSGTTRDRYTLGITGPAWANWSPDGNRLSLADVRAGTGFGQNLYTLRADGSGLSQITGFMDATNGFPFGALWSPEGDALIGAGTIGGVNGLWIIPLSPDATECVGMPIRLPTTFGDAIDIAGSIRVRTAPPALRIRQDADDVVVFWDKDARGYVLEGTSELQPASVWIRFDGPYTISGNFNEVRFPDSILAEMAFFRLVRP